MNTAKPARDASTNQLALKLLPPGAAFAKPQQTEAFKHPPC